jgi:hypothetical protein
MGYLNEPGFSTQYPDLAAIRTKFATCNKSHLCSLKSANDVKAKAWPYLVTCFVFTIFEHWTAGNTETSRSKTHMTLAREIYILF